MFTPAGGSPFAAAGTSEDLGTRIAREHRDHSNHDHVHAIGALDCRLDRGDVRDLREHADDVWRK